MAAEENEVCYQVEIYSIYGIPMIWLNHKCFLSKDEQFKKYVAASYGRVLKIGKA